MVWKATKWQIKRVLKTGSWQTSVTVTYLAPGTAEAPANGRDLATSGKIGPESGRVTLDLQSCFQEFPSEQKADISARKHELWVGLIHRYKHVCHQAHTATETRLPSLLEALLPWFLMRPRANGRGGRRFSKFTPSSMNTNCRMGCNGRSPFLPKPWLFLVWLSRFTNGMIQNKMSITTPLVTCGGTGMRNQTKAVLQVSQNEKIPSAENATDWLLSKFPK